MRHARRRQLAALAGLALAGGAASAMSATPPADPTAQARARMVAEIDALYADTRGETGLGAMTPAVRTAIGRVLRHRLVPGAQADQAYANRPLPIGRGQTISQPYIVALSTDLVRPAPGHVVLDVGTGSGYQAAVLAELVQQVYSIEIIDSLARTASLNLSALGYRNIEIRVGDGYAGWPEHAPFDGIVVAAAAPRVPETLVRQLRPGGRMVIPLGDEGEIQFLTVITHLGDGRYEMHRVLPVRFVPLVPGR